MHKMDCFKGRPKGAPQGNLEEQKHSIRSLARFSKVETTQDLSSALPLC